MVLTRLVVASAPGYTQVVFSPESSHTVRTADLRRSTSVASVSQHSPAVIEMHVKT